MTKKADPKPNPSPEELQILMENAAKEYQKLDKSDDRFIGIDMDTREYWILGNSLKIKQLGYNSSKVLEEMFEGHDAIVKDLEESDGPENEAKRIGLMQQRQNAKNSIIEEGLPIMLDDGKGFDKEGLGFRFCAGQALLFH